jgi:RNA polymerase sigma factor (sigma-70 family)
MNMKTNEDIVHEAMLIIYDKYKEIEFERGVLPWAFGVLDKVMKGDYRTELRRENILQENKDEVLELHDCNTSLENCFDSCELIDEIWESLNQLNNTEKKIFKYIIYGYTREEIQHKLGVSRTTLDVSVFRGRKKLKKNLEKRGAI